MKREENQNLVTFALQIPFSYAGGLVVAIEVDKDQTS